MLAASCLAPKDEKTKNSSREKLNFKASSWFNPGCTEDGGWGWDWGRNLEVNQGQGSSTSAKGLPSRPTLGHCWWGCKMEHLLLKTVWRFLKKLKTKLAYDPVTPLLDIQPNELKAES